MDSNVKSSSVALLFAGQGNPVIGMGADLWDINKTTKAIWDCASDISGIDLRRCCLKGPMNKLIQTTIQQLAVTAINVSLYSLMREKLGAMSIVGSCGHSVGEYSALYAAGAISLEALFKMIDFRAKLMNELSKVNKGSMLAVKGVDYLTMRDLLSQSDLALDISCDNSRCQQVIGGTSPALTHFAQELTANRYETMKLGVSGAWHTHLMSDGVQLIRDFLADIKIEKPQHEVLMNVTGRPEFNPQTIRENLSLHLTHTVKWTDSLEYFLAHKEPVTFIEISNKAYLGHLLNDFPSFSAQMSLHCKKII
jgi:[acyl-carrier-protein] S-malonyltransferase